MIDLSDEKVIEQLHQAGWREVPTDCVVINSAELRKLIFNNLSESDREWIERFIRGETTILNKAASVGVSDDRSSEHNRVLDGGHGQAPPQAD